MRDLFEIGRVSDCGYLRPNKKLLVDIFTTKESLDRALDAANALFVSLEERGHRVLMTPNGHDYHGVDVDHREKDAGHRGYSETWRPARPTVVMVGTVAIGLALFELSENVEVRRVDGQYLRVPPRPAGGRGALDTLREWTHHRDMPTGRLCLVGYSPYPRAPWKARWAEERRGSFKAMVA